MELEIGEIKMIIFLFGQDTYRSRQRLKQLIAGFVKKYDRQALNIERLIGKDLTFGSFQRAVTSGGFFTQKRLIVIENLVYDNQDPNIIEQIRDYLKQRSVHQDNILIFWEGDEQADWQKQKRWAANGLIKNLKKTQTAEEFEKLKGRELNQWLIRELKKLGGIMDKKAFELLIDLTGGDLWSLASELRKLVAYRAGQAITESDIYELVKAKADQDIFHLVDAVAGRKRVKAIKLLADQLKTGASPSYLLYRLRYHFRSLLLAKELPQATPAILSKELKLHPYVAQKVSDQAKVFSLNQLKDIYQGLFSIEAQLKSSRLNPELFFDLLFIKI